MDSVRLQRVLSAASAVVSAVIVGVMLVACTRGFDFTDEGYYVVSIADPGLYSAGATQFGFVYHPLFELLGSDIVRLRQANVVLTFGLAWLLAYVLLRKLVDVRAQRLAISAAVATASMMIFAIWVITPSYNSLALQGVMVTMLGVALVEERWWAWALIGLGGVIALLAKPTTALALAALVLLCLFAMRTFRWRGALVVGAVAVGTLAACALAIDGSLVEFWQRTADGADQMKLLDARHDVSAAVRIDAIEPGERLLLLALAFAGIVVAVAYARRLTAAVIVVALAAVAVLAVYGHVAEVLGTNPQRALLFLAIPAAALLVLDLRRAALAVTLLLLPLAYAFGSNGNYWQVGGSAAVLWVLAGVVAVGRRSLPALAAVGIVSQVAIVALLAAGDPYRQLDPLADQTIATGIGSSTIHLGPGVAAYVREASRVARDAGFEPGTPMIDLTGKSPGLLYALDAEPIGQAWMIGGYPGSDELAIESLELSGCKDVSTSWILTEFSGARSLSESVLVPFGATLADDYEVAGSWDTAPGVAGFADPVRQVLWRPTRSSQEALSACQSAS
ncbi:hypothetical protein GCM10022234_20630 [Aeromicrobium panaciterrae]|uniref:hypothetical protein n=1 Tax=Aeromicrobium panaciterrae TaxID=363861 RepID=UPI0031D2EE54